MKYISPFPTDEYSSTFPRTLSICGSTGSIGHNTLRIAAAYPELFQVTALGAGKNISLLAQQAHEFRPKYLVIQDEKDLPNFQNLITNSYGYRPQILVGKKGYEEIATLREVTTFVSAQVGAAGLQATHAAANAGKVICLANKESLVLAGKLLRDVCGRSKATILPVDSEHHALFQCLMGRDPDDMRRLVLTASGGAFRDKTSDFLHRARAEDALKHPNWSMGAKITVDSATLMNKGLEIIEACHLFGVDLSTVEVVVHPQSIIHSMVEYKDFSFIAQLSKPDMRLPIAHCLAYPTMLEAEKCDFPKLDFFALKELTFEAVDNTKFPCLELAKNAFRERKCVALNAVNEVCVDAFLNNRISFMQIPKIIEKILEKAEKDSYGIDGILESDAEYRQQANHKLKLLK